MQVLARTFSPNAPARALVATVVNTEAGSPRAASAQFSHWERPIPNTPRAQVVGPLRFYGAGSGFKEVQGLPKGPASSIEAHPRRCTAASSAPPPPQRQCYAGGALSEVHFKAYPGPDTISPIRA